MNRDTVYGKGITYNAMTHRYLTMRGNLLTNIEIETPDFYEIKKTVNVIALWDTGATRSCITRHFVDELGLKPTDFAQTYGVGGMNETEIFDIILHLNGFLRNIPLQVTGAKLHKEDGGPPNSEVGFLIGMDIIGNGDFFTGCYNDTNGKPCTLMTFRFPTAFYPVDYLNEVNDYNNSLKEQQTRCDALSYRKNYVGKNKKGKKKRK